MILCFEWNHLNGWMVTFITLWRAIVGSVQKHFYNLSFLSDSARLRQSGFTKGENH